MDHAHVWQGTDVEGRSQGRPGHGTVPVRLVRASDVWRWKLTREKIFETLLQEYYDNEHSSEDNFYKLAAALCGPREAALIYCYMRNFSWSELGCLRHALGWSQTPRLSKLGWRNYYNAPEGDPVCDGLCARGYMDRQGDNYFVTKAGMENLGMSEAAIKKAKGGGQ